LICLYNVYIMKLMLWILSTKTPRTTLALYGTHLLEARNCGLWVSKYFEVDQVLTHICLSALFGIWLHVTEFVLDIDPCTTDPEIKISDRDVTVLSGWKLRQTAASRQARNFSQSSRSVERPIYSGTNPKDELGHMTQLLKHRIESVPVIWNRNEMTLKNRRGAQFGRQFPSPCGEMLQKIDKR
jgi:hypothetical protein